MIVIVADSVPSTPGANDTVIVQVVEAASVEPQLPPVTEKSAALFPPKFSLSVTACV